jgi:hypothetical protein
MALKTYRYVQKPALGLEDTFVFSTAPSVAEVSGGPYTVDITIEETEKDAVDAYMAKHRWEFDQELP